MNFLSIAILIFHISCENAQLSQEWIEIMSALDFSEKRSLVKGLVNYPSLKSENFKTSFQEFINDREFIPWDEIIEQIKNPKIHEMYPIPLLQDFLRVLQNISREMYIDYCDNVIIKNRGFHVLHINNTRNDYGVIAVIKIDTYRVVLLKSYRLQRRSSIQIFSDWIDQHGALIFVTIMITFFGFMGFAACRLSPK